MTGGTLPPQLPLVWERGIKGAYPKLPEPLSFARRGPSGLLIWMGIVGTAGFGGYELGNALNTLHMVETERRRRRVLLAGYLQAEEDARFRAAMRVQRDFENRIMSQGSVEVQGGLSPSPEWDPQWKQYHGRWQAPMMFHFSMHQDTGDLGVSVNPYHGFGTVSDALQEM